MPQVLTDDFNRASIGSDWLLVQGTAGIMSQSNTCWQPNDTGLNHTTYARNTSGVTYCPNQYSKAVVASVEASNYAGVAVRVNAATGNTMYFFHVSGYDRTVGRFEEGGFTSLHNSVVAAVNGDTIELRAVGSLITALVNGTVIFSYHDPNPLKGGNYGIHGYTNATGTNSTSLNSWEGGDIVSSQGDPMPLPNGGNEFQWRVSNSDTVRPAAAIGTTVTPGANNAKGSWVQLLPAIANDAYVVELNFNSGSTSAAARDILADIGIDPAGGSSYSVLIPNLLASCAGSHTDLGGINYTFRLRIPAGASVGCRAQVNNATAGSLKCAINLLGKPTRPDLCRVGAGVIAVGVTTASSSGTATTVGTTSDGSWTSLGSPSKEAWEWQLGMGVNDGTMTALCYSADLASGDGTNKKLIIQDQMFRTDSNERLGTSGQEKGTECPVPTTSTLYVRSQCSSTADSAISYAAYGVYG